MRRKVVFLTLFLMMILAGCSHSKEVEVSVKESLNIWQEHAGEGYEIHVFIEKEPISDEVDVIWGYKKYENWSGLKIHRGIRSTGNGDVTVDYLEAFDEERYPFYLVVSKDGIELQSNSVYEVKSFFEEFGGKIN